MNIFPLFSSRRLQCSNALFHHFEEEAQDAPITRQLNLKSDPMKNYSDQGRYHIEGTSHASEH